MDRLPPLRIETYSAARLGPLLGELARLRMAVFRDWPYLYDGDAGFEERYLADFARAPSAALVVAYDGDTVVGCSSCLRLDEELDAVQAPFRAAGIDPGRVFYFGESVLLAPYRGRGAGVGFFAAREAHARATSECDFAAFCAVIRPGDHPLKPPGAAGLDGFWRRRGFTPYPDLVCRLAWKQVDGEGEVENLLSFWLKPLRGAKLP
jgi:GNAT superfamily N-acetyltransferase